MVIGTAGQMIAQIAREVGKELNLVFLREVKLMLAVKLKKWGGDEEMEPDPAGFEMTLLVFSSLKDRPEV